LKPLSSSYCNTDMSAPRRCFRVMPILDKYVLREFLIPFSVLLFAFSILFMITDIFNDLNEFLEHQSSVFQMIEYFSIRVLCNISFIFPITVLLSCIYTLANFGRHREITAMRASGISLVRVGFPMYAIAFLVSCTHFWFNEKLVPECEMRSTMIIKKLSDSDYQKRQTSQLQFLSSDKMRNWFFGYLDRNDGIQESVKLKMFRPDPF